MKNIIKSLIPPILLPIIKAVRMAFVRFMGNKKPVYKFKVFHHYDELELKFDNVWESKNWLTHVEKSLIDSFESISNIHSSAVLKSILILANDYKGREITVYDFGGGCGVLVPHINKFANKFNLLISINIVDSISNIKLGKIHLNEFKNVRFFDQDEVDLDLLMETISPNSPIILNMSSVLQYIYPYDKFLSSILKLKNPKIVCITRFPRCEDSEIDAYAIQEVRSSIGYCGSVMVNLFGKNSLINVMNKLGYEMLFEEFGSIGDAHYFDKCSDNKFKKITIISYIFIAI